MTKRGFNRAQAQTTVVKGTITVKQKEVLNSLIGILGSNEQDVVGKILTLWLYNEGFLKNIQNKKRGRKSK